MKSTSGHPQPPVPGHKMGFVPVVAVEGGNAIWLAGCGPTPIYHKHPHDAVEEIPGDMLIEIDVIAVVP